MLVLSLGPLAVPAAAEGEKDPAWLADKKNLEAAFSSKDLSDDTRCMRVWDILWPHAKKGNFEARKDLFLLTAFLPFFHRLYMPANSGDQITQLRHATILAAHSSGYQFDKASQQTYQEASSLIYYQTLSHDETGRQFIKCLETNHNQNCIKNAVEKKILPSFDAYKNEIDALLDQGMKPSCSFINHK